MDASFHSYFSMRGEPKEQTDRHTRGKRETRTRKKESAFSLMGGYESKEGRKWKRKERDGEGIVK